MYYRELVQTVWIDHTGRRFTDLILSECSTPYRSVLPEHHKHLSDNFDAYAGVHTIGLASA